MIEVRAARALEVRIGAARARVEAHAFGAQRLRAWLCVASQLGRVAQPGLARDDELEIALLRAQLLVAVGLRGLAIERRDLAPQLDQDVVHAQQVLLGRACSFDSVSLRRCRYFPMPGGLLEDHAPLFGLARDQVRDLALLDDRVAARADARVHEEVEHVAQPHRHLVDHVLALARAVEPARDLDLGVRAVRRRREPVGVVERQHDLAHADRGLLLGAREDQVLHVAAAQLARVVLAHHPAQRVDHVRLAAAVRTRRSRRFRDRRRRPFGRRRT